MKRTNRFVGLTPDAFGLPDCGRVTFDLNEWTPSALRKLTEAIQEAIDTTTDDDEQFLQEELHFTLDALEFVGGREF